MDPWMADGLFAAVIGASMVDLFLGEFCTLLPVVLSVESALRPRDIALADANFRLSSFLAEMEVKEIGEGGGKAELLLSETREGTLPGRAMTTGVEVRPLTIRPTPTLLPQPAVLGNAATCGSVEMIS